MASLEKVILDKNLSVLSKSSDGRLLTLLITVHCLAKNELKNSAGLACSDHVVICSLLKLEQSVDVLVAG